ncbi:unnamed protein product [Polarella glacialis]|uniref:protein-L-isoaspartate(D-aspartate) O-methyltransferase n=1 Tax=Polarella glacialis TaxID=89957 RepID=A0A813EAN5_POLGL|nr:unnamed protein product [Polarella glacialis]
MVPTELPRCRFCGVPLSSATSHGGLCANLRRHGVLSSDAAAAAYGAVDRGDFIPEGEPYLDAAAVLGTTGAQVSAPHVHAAALELIQERAAALEVELSDSRQLRVLDLGSGCCRAGAASWLWSTSRSLRNGLAATSPRTTRTCWKENEVAWS